MVLASPVVHKEAAPPGGGSHVAPPVPFPAGYLQQQQQQFMLAQQQHMFMQQQQQMLFAQQGPPAAMMPPLGHLPLPLQLPAAMAPPAAMPSTMFMCPGATSIVRPHELGLFVYVFHNQGPSGSGYYLVGQLAGEVPGGYLAIAPPQQQPVVVAPVAAPTLA